MTIGLSYAQNFEDVLLWRALSHVRNGTYLDVGACDPVNDSVSKAFYLAGWRGVHVDASPTYAQALRADRPDELVIQAAVGDATGTITFYEFPETGLSTCVAEFAERHIALGLPCTKTTVPTIPLSALLELAAKPEIHWLKIDVEGLEGSVLRSWEDCPIRPWVLVIESTEPNTQIPTHGEWYGLVTQLGYHEVATDGLSRFFVSDEHHELDAAFVDNPNIFDDFSVTERHFSARAIMAEWHAKRGALRSRQEELADELSQLQIIQLELAESNCTLQREHDQRSALVRSRELELSRLKAEQQAFTAERRQLEQDAVTHRVELARLAERLAALDEERARLVTAVAERELERGQMLANLKQAQADIVALATAQSEERQQAQRLLEQQIANAAQAHAALQQAYLAERQCIEAEIATLRLESGHQQRLLQQASGVVGEAASLLRRPGLALFGAIIARKQTRRVRGLIETWRSLPPGSQTFSHTSELPAPAQTGPMERPMDMFTPDLRNPFLRADSLEELCSFADLDFVRCAYVTLLGRQPEPAGEAYYVARVRSGISKLTILRQLRLSAEARRHDPGIAGLDVTLRKHRNANLPIIGPVIRRLFGREGNSPVERRLRAVENTQSVAARQATDRFLHMNHLLHELDHSVGRVRQELRLGRSGRGGSGSSQAERQLNDPPGDWTSSIAKSLAA